MARRGRNNRIFYKPMEKAIFDYDSNDDNKDAASTAGKKLNNKTTGYKNKTYDCLPSSSSYIHKQM